MSLADYNEHNVSNSVAVLLGDRLLNLGYLLYWHHIDAVQTPDQWYPAYSVNQDTYLADATYAARVAAAKGLLTVLGEKSAIPRFITRPTISGQVQPQEFVPIPAVAVVVGDVVTDSQYELGTRNKWRARTLELEVFCRDTTEQATFSDAFTEWFDDDVTFDILDHTTGSLAIVGDVTVEDGKAESSTDADEANATTYEVVFNARLVFVA